MANLKNELQTPRWGLDLLVCWVAACGFYLFVVWQTLMFETSLPKPQKLIGDMLFIVLAYTLSMFAGHIFKRKEWSTAVWVPVVGSVFLSLIWIGRAIPGSIDHYYRFTPEASLFGSLIREFAWALFGIAVVLMVGTLIPTFAARGLIWLSRRFSKMA